MKRNLNKRYWTVEMKALHKSKKRKYDGSELNWFRIDERTRWPDLSRIGRFKSEGDE